jgi:diguanylate cyclase (GGDEF)-like protein
MRWRWRGVDRVLAEATTSVCASLDMSEVLPAVARAAERTLRADRATCYVVSRERVVAAVYSTETDPRSRAFLEASVGLGPADIPIWRHQLSQARSLLVVPDVLRERAISPRLASRLGARAFLGIRLEHPSVEEDGRPALLGTLFCGYHRPRRFSARDRSAGLALGSLAALALANARLHSETLENLAQAERLAVSDPLTGLPNRRAFDEHLDAEIRRASRRGRPLSLAIFDLDNFKRVNDRHGHQVGDDVLVEAARRLRDEARSGDMLARVGGEEFAWILPETGALEAWQAAERGRAAIARWPFPGVGPLTVSAGVCDLSLAADAGELFRNADTALYWAKRNGRDICIRYAPDVGDALSAREQSRRLERSRADAYLHTLAQLADAQHSGRRSRRVADLAVRLATAAGWSRERAALLHAAGLLHDVGRIGLSKEDASGDDPALRRERAVLGAQIAARVLDDEQASWIRHQGERWNGAGWPDGLAGGAIPEGALLLGVATAWDELTGSRPAARALSATQALDVLKAEGGRRFAPSAIAALLALWEAEGLEERPSAAPRRNEELRR